MQCFCKSLDKIEWGSSEAYNYTIRGIENSKLLLKKDKLYLKFFQNGKTGLYLSNRAYWPIPACCAATLGIIMSYTKKSLWPAVLCLMPGLYGLFQQAITRKQKAIVDRTLNLLCITQTSIFGILECNCRSICLESIGGTGILQSLPPRADINRIINTMYWLMADVNKQFNMNYPLPEEIVYFSGSSVTFGSVEDAISAYHTLREFNEIYSKIISKALLSCQLYLSVDGYDSKNTEKSLILYKKFPQLIQVLEERGNNIVYCFRNMQYTTNHPINSKLTCMHQSIECYNNQLNYMCARIDAYMSGSEHTQNSMKDVIVDLDSFRKTIGTYIVDMTENQEEMRADFKATAESMASNSLKDTEMRNQVKTQIECLIANISEHMCDDDEHDDKNKITDLDDLALCSLENLGNKRIISKSASMNNLPLALFQSTKEQELKDDMFEIPPKDLNTTTLHKKIIETDDDSYPVCNIRNYFHNIDKPVFIKNPDAYRIWHSQVVSYAKSDQRKHTMSTIEEELTAKTDGPPSVGSCSCKGSWESIDDSSVECGGTYSAAEEDSDSSYETISTTSSTDLDNYNNNSNDVKVHTNTIPSSNNKSQILTTSPTDLSAVLQGARGLPHNPVPSVNIRQPNPYDSGKPFTITQIPPYFKDILFTPPPRNIIPKPCRVTATNSPGNINRSSIHRVQNFRHVCTNEAGVVGIEAVQVEQATKARTSRDSVNTALQQEIIRRNFIKHARTIARLRNEEHIYFNH